MIDFPLVAASTPDFVMQLAIRRYAQYIQLHNGTCRMHARKLYYLFQYVMNLCGNWPCSKPYNPPPEKTDQALKSYRIQADFLGLPPLEPLARAAAALAGVASQFPHPCLAAKDPDDQRCDAQISIQFFPVQAKTFAHRMRQKLSAQNMEFATIRLRNALSVST